MDDDEEEDLEIWDILIKVGGVFEGGDLWKREDGWMDGREVVAKIAGL